MFKRIQILYEDVIAFEVQGSLTKEDYIETLIPLIEKARSLGNKSKLLIHFGDSFEGFTSAGAWEDLKLGIHHMNTFERVAIPTDWSKGDLVIIPPNITNEEADRKFPQGFKYIKKHGAKIRHQELRALEKPSLDKE